MAHHLAELLDKLERADANARPTLKRETADLVLAVWDRKGRWPIDLHQPLDALQPLLSALERLQPDQPDWSFFQYFREEDPPDASVSDLLKAAVLIERRVRDVVRGCILVASQQVTDTEAPWLEVARRLGAEDEATLVQRLRQRLATARDGSDAADPPATPAPVENLREDVVKLQQLLAEVAGVLASSEENLG